MPLSIPITTLSHNLNKLWPAVEDLTGRPCKLMGNHSNILVGKTDIFDLASTQGSPIIHYILWGNRHGYATRNDSTR
jgi:hypothetical protein